MIRFHCQSCAQKIRMDDAHAGRRVKCPACAHVLVVPHPQEQESPTAVASRPRVGAAGTKRNDPRPSSPRAVCKRSAGSSVDAGQGKSTPATTRRRSIELVFLGGLIVIATVALVFGTLVTKLFFLLVLLTTLNGYWLGASKVSAVFAGMLVAVLLAVPTGTAFEGAIGGLFGLSGLIGRLTSIATCGAVEMLIVAGVLQIVLRKLLKNRPAWRRYDKLAGSGLGLLEGAMLGFLLIWAVLVLEPLAVSRVQSPGAASSNAVAERVVAIAEVVRSSRLGQMADAANPLDEMRLITLSQKCLVILNDPVRRVAFVNHPTVVGIKQRPSFEQAMDILHDDPRVRQIVESEAEVTADDLFALLNGPALLRILDETTLAAELSAIADDVERAIDEAVEQSSPERPDG